MSFADAVLRRIREMIPAPQIVTGTLVSATPAQVSVAGVADQPVPCDWSATFDAEMRAATSLVGRLVEVHIVDGQHIVAHTIVIGAKPNGV